MQIFRMSQKGARNTIILIVVVAIAATISNFLVDTEIEQAAVTSPAVTLTTVSEYNGAQELSVIGNVRAFSEAAITSEVAGRVTAVNVELGESVQAGRILVTLENSTERASLLQAEGVYDAALAAAAQNNIGTDQAETALTSVVDSAITTFKSSYNTTNGIVVNSIDQFFANPNDRVPGLRIDGQGQTASLNNERVAYQELLANWLAKTNTISPASDIQTELEHAKSNVQRTISLVDTFIFLFNNQDSNSRYTDSELQGFSTTFTNLRATLISIESGLDNSIHSLQTATDNLKKSELAASGGAVSASDAQVKQALGALASAQAKLNKTILRTPISGTVNTISVRQGDFINSFMKVAEVANNSALEVVTFVSDADKAILTIGDKVLIENEFTGTVTHIAPAINSDTKKTEVRIATEGVGVSNGDTVKITMTATENTIVSREIRVPLTAIKFNREDGHMFFVSDSKLVKVPVVLGPITGNSVMITEGITTTDEFVTDVRGLVAGEEVTVKN